MNFHLNRYELAKQRVAAIKVYHYPGCTARHLADKLGTTRNAVIGLYNRNRDELADYPLPKAGNATADSDGAPRNAQSIRIIKPNNMPRLVFKNQVAPSISSTDVSAMVADWITKNGAPRRFERGASADAMNIRQYLMERGYPVQGTSGNYRVANAIRRTNWAGVIDFADKLRVSEGLQPFRARAAA